MARLPGESAVSFVLLFLVMFFTDNSYVFAVGSTFAQSARGVAEKSLCRNGQSVIMNRIRIGCWLWRYVAWCVAGRLKCPRVFVQNPFVYGTPYIFLNNRRKVVVVYPQGGQTLLRFLLYRSSAWRNSGNFLYMYWLDRRKWRLAGLGSSKSGYKLSPGI